MTDAPMTIQTSIWMSDDERAALAVLAARESLKTAQIIRRSFIAALKDAGLDPADRSNWDPGHTPKATTTKPRLTTVDVIAGALATTRNTQTPPTARELAEDLSISPSAVTTALKKLTAAGRARRLGVASNGAATWVLTESEATR